MLNKVPIKTSIVIPTLHAGKFNALKVVISAPTLIGMYFIKNLYHLVTIGSYK